MGCVPIYSIDLINEAIIQFHMDFWEVIRNFSFAINVIKYVYESDCWYERWCG